MSAGLLGAPETILIAEDDDNDVFLLKRAFAKNGIHEGLYVVVNGLEAVAYLSGQGKYGDRQRFPFPTLVITDLRMPLMDGLELLQWMHAEPTCRNLRTALLSSATLGADQSAALQSGACCYYSKPSSPKDLVDLVKHIYERRRYHSPEELERSRETH